MKCIKCGSESVNDARFCGNCGNGLIENIEKFNIIIE